MTFGRWVSRFMVPYGIAQGLLLLCAGAALKLRAGSLWFPYLLILWCGVIGASLMYWTRKSDAAERTRRLRFAASVFVLEIRYIGVLVYSAVKVNLLSESTALTIMRLTFFHFLGLVRSLHISCVAAIRGHRSLRVAIC
jgi:hypothetical protein